MQPLIERLQSAQKILAITGAGVSAESGIPTFRGSDGLWNKYDPTELATPEAFQRDPRLVWEWYNWRRELVKKAEPNDAHHTLAKWEKEYPHSLLVTQNVDRLHHRAGSQKVVEVHGNILEARCTREGTIFSDAVVEQQTELPPRCPDCNALLRPHVVWFGEILPHAPLQRIGDYLSAAPSVDVCFVIGTSALFGYIQSWALHSQHQKGFLVEINPEPTPLTQLCDLSLHGKAAVLLPQIYSSLHPSS